MKKRFISVLIAYFTCIWKRRLYISHSRKLTVMCEKKACASSHDMRWGSQAIRKLTDQNNGWKRRHVKYSKLLLVSKNSQSLLKSWALAPRNTHIGRYNAHSSSRSSIFYSFIRNSHVGFSFQRCHSSNNMSNCFRIPFNGKWCSILVAWSSHLERALLSPPILLDNFQPNIFKNRHPSLISSEC